VLELLQVQDKLREEFNLAIEEVQSPQVVQVPNLVGEALEQLVVPQVELLEVGEAFKSGNSLNLEISQSEFNEVPQKSETFHLSELSIFSQIKFGEVGELRKSVRKLYQFILSKLQRSLQKE